MMSVFQGWILVCGQRIAEAHTTKGTGLRDPLRRFYVFKAYKKRYLYIGFYVVIHDIFLCVFTGVSWCMDGHLSIFGQCWHVEPSDRQSSLMVSGARSLLECG